MLRAIIADNQPESLAHLQNLIDQAQTPVTIVGTADNGADALQLLLTQRPDLAFLEMHLPDMGGLEIVERARLEQCTTRFIMLTGCAVFSDAQAALRLGVSDLLLKPADPTELVMGVNRAMGMQFSANRQVNDILLYLSQNMHRNLTLKEIADRFFISSYHLSHLFKKYMGKTCIECMHWMRIERAMQLLRNTNMSIKEISERIGYANLNNFYMHFKKLTGTTPKVYVTRGSQDSAEQ